MVNINKYEKEIREKNSFAGKNILNACFFILKKKNIWRKNFNSGLRGNYNRPVIFQEIRPHTFLF